MKQASTQKPAKQTGTGPLPQVEGQFAYRDGVWYLTPAPKTDTKATS